VAAGVEVARLRTERAALRALAAERGAQAAALRATVADQAQAIERLTGPDVRVVELASARSSTPRARLFWDRASDSWLFYAHRLPRARPGRTYQLWLVTRTAKISAGTFDSSPAGDASLRARYPLSPADLTAVAVTDEPAGGVPVATGQVVLLGGATR
jgi:anti-sigma-K factor RskA